MLLRAHVLQNLHRFKESEALAWRLVQQRGLSFDYGLLGDALMEQGKLNEAVEAYQQMMNLKPDLRAYARAAHMRWLKGDLDGAIEAMQLAVSAASPQDAESAAWVNTRLATYLFYAGKFNEAEQRCALALSLQNNYPQTLLLQGRILLGQSRFGEAVDALQNAVKLNPLPEYQWTLAEALRAAGKENEASEVEAQLCQRGASNDPRTLALYLATRHESPDTALRLARAELDSRSDVFTHDALAWSLAAAGNWLKRIARCSAHWRKAPRTRGCFSMLASSLHKPVTQPMRSAGYAKRVNYHICFCRLSAMNFKTRRVALKKKPPLPQTHKKLFRSGQIPRGKPNPKPKKTDEKNNIPHVARSHGTDRGPLNRSRASLQSHGCAADHSRSGSQHHGRLRVRAK